MLVAHISLPSFDIDMKEPYSITMGLVESRVLCAINFKLNVSITTFFISVIPFITDCIIRPSLLNRPICGLLFWSFPSSSTSVFYVYVLCVMFYAVTEIFLEKYFSAMLDPK